MSKSLQNIKDSIVWTLYSCNIKPFSINLLSGFSFTYSGKRKLSTQNLPKKRINFATWNIKKVKVQQCVDTFHNWQLKAKANLKPCCKLITGM